MKKCNICNKEKSIDEFYKSGKSNAGTQLYRAYCKPCEIIKRRKDHWIKIRKVLKVKIISCELCGYNKNLAALDFHHLEDEDKKWEISRLGNSRSSLKRYEEELAKCVVLCSNCHREHHNPHSIQEIQWNDVIIAE